MSYKYVKSPQQIEHNSFDHVQSIIDEKYPDYVFKNEMEETIIKRAIYTTADFDYLYTLKFSGDVIAKMIAALKNKATIFTDTTMVLAGINKRVLDNLEVRYECPINDTNVAAYAKEKGVTRSMAMIEYAAKTEGAKIFVFGNAPTAIYRTLELIEMGVLTDVAAIIGVPVGFIGVPESKQTLHHSAVPSIVALGNKGGSNLAAGLFNAILYQMNVETEDYQRYQTNKK